MKLYLSGGGKEAFEVDKEFVSNLDKAKPILYIPIAIDTKRHPYPSCLEFIKNYFGSIGFDNIDMVTDIKSISESQLSDYSGIYIGGGNTFYLLSEMKKTGFWNILKKAVKDNIPIAGSSAGSLIHAKTIIPALPYDNNYLKLTDLRGYNHLKDYEVWCHYDDSMDDKIEEYMAKYNLKKVIGLPELSAIVVDNDKIKICGNTAWIFDKDGKNVFGAVEKRLFLNKSERKFHKLSEGQARTS